MLYRKEIVTAAGTLCCAIAIGFVMQGSETAKQRYGQDNRQSVDPESVIASSALLNVKEITLTSAAFETSVVAPQQEMAVTPVSTPAIPLPEPDVASETLDPDCDVAAEARAVAGAIISFSLSAPCLANERLTLHHSGMIFSALTSGIGKLEVLIPALEENALIVAAFPNGDGAVARTTVDELADFDRVVLQWKGDTGFGLHAREYGAEYGAAGHIWSGASGDVAAAVTGSGGFITPLGDKNVADGLMAEVYTFPTMAAIRSGIIDLSVEAEVTQANCGMEIEAKAIQVKRGEAVKSRALTLSVPECDATDSFLVLNNLLQDLKVAGS